MTIVTKGNVVASFIDSLELNDECKRLAEVLFDSEECCKEYYIGFRNRNRYAIDDLLDYREEKLKSCQKGIDELREMCYNTIMMQEALQNTFLQTITLGETRMVEKAIADGRTSLEVIYSEFQKNPNKNILKNVL
jgi:hypothetical protein